MKTFRCIFFLALFILKGIYFAPAQNINDGHPHQSGDEQLAVQFYQNKEYEKAADLFEKLYGKNPTLTYYNPLLDCYIQLKEFKRAEKLVKRQVKFYPGDLQFSADQALILESSGKQEEANEKYLEVINQLTSDQNQVISLANYFLSRKNSDYAIKTYLRGRKIIRNDYPFNFELAEIYFLRGDNESMFAELLDVLEINPGYLQNVQNTLIPKLSDDPKNPKNELLRLQLLKKIQKSPTENMFSEMLIWLFIQQRDFNSAIVHAKSLDKRLKEDGGRLMSIGSLALNNNDYEAAIQAYQYVIQKGNGIYFYANAKMELIVTMNKKTLAKQGYTRIELEALENTYAETITDLGKSPATMPLIIGLARLKAFYLYKNEEAIASLEEAITIPGLKPMILAECKLELGDILLMAGNPWDASLYYGQVEKAYKHDPIGQEAKFRNSRLYYYIGDFGWAQAQLDVLKASTSKLIANDALDLSLLISDNTTVDTNKVPLHMFARADLLYFQNKQEPAIQLLDSIADLFPDHSLNDEILFKKYQIFSKNGDFINAASYLEKIISFHSMDILGDDAVFYLAKIQEENLLNKEKAMELYEKLMVEFPGSMFTVEARKRYRLLRGDVIN